MEVTLLNLQVLINEININPFNWIFIKKKKKFHLATSILSAQWNRDSRKLWSRRAVPAGGRSIGAAGRPRRRYRALWQRFEHKPQHSHQLLLFFLQKPCCGNWLQPTKNQHQSDDGYCDNNHPLVRAHLNCITTASLHAQIPLTTDWIGLNLFVMGKKRRVWVGIYRWSLSHAIVGLFIRNFWMK